MKVGNPRFFLEHMQEAASRIQASLPRTYPEFLEDYTVQAAILHWLQIIGEASRNLGKEFHERHPVLPWSEIISFRNLIVHEYFRLDHELVWSIALDKIPGLLTALEHLLPFYPPPAE